MPINIEDHLTAEEMKQIARDAFSEQCAEKFRTDHERNFGNVAHKIVWGEVDKLIDGNIAEAIAQRVAEIIPKVSEHTIFVVVMPDEDCEAPFAYPRMLIGESE
jgi:Tfp pilus assembly ATPase PilU